MSSQQLAEVMASSPPQRRQNEPRESTKQHHNAQCATLHPLEPSCLVNGVKSAAYESTRVGRWVGAFTLVTLLASKRSRNALFSSPRTAFMRWLAASVRGTAFVVGRCVSIAHCSELSSVKYTNDSVNTGWALNCASHRFPVASRYPQLRYVKYTLIELSVRDLLESYYLRCRLSGGLYLVVSNPSGFSYLHRNDGKRSVCTLLDWLRSACGMLGS